MSVETAGVTVTVSWVVVKTTTGVGSWMVRVIVVVGTDFTDLVPNTVLQVAIDTWA